MISLLWLRRDLGVHDHPAEKPAARSGVTTRSRSSTTRPRGRVDGAWLDDELAAPQHGDFYGGWITADVLGPFKGAPGTLGW
jgi:hypothetical protein